jgi:hypothetical protein
MRKSSPVLVLLITAILLLLCLVAFVWLSVPSAPPVVLPNPNGFPQFLVIGRTIVGIPANIADSDADTLERFLDSNAAVLDESLAALQLECMVPIEYTAAYQQRVVDDIRPLKNVARLLWADARLAELEGDLEEAAEKYADVIRFSQKTSNGGLLIHLQSGIAYERLGWEALLRLAPSLSKEQQAALRKQLASTNRAALKVEDYMTREKALATVVHGRFIVFITSRASDVDANEQRSLKLIKDMQSAREQVMQALAE